MGKKIARVLLIRGGALFPRARQNLLCQNPQREGSECGGEWGPRALRRSVSTAFSASTWTRGPSGAPFLRPKVACLEIVATVFSSLTVGIFYSFFWFSFEIAHPFPAKKVLRVLRLKVELNLVPQLRGVVIFQAKCKGVARNASQKVAVHGRAVRERGGCGHPAPGRRWSRHRRGRVRGALRTRTLLSVFPPRGVFQIGEVG